jgi:hypothetical protein
MHLEAGAQEESFEVEVWADKTAVVAVALGGGFVHWDVKLL